MFLWRRVRDSNPRYLRTQHFECCTFDHSDNSPYSISLVILTDIKPFVNHFLSAEKRAGESLLLIICLSVVDKLCELNGINDFAVLVNTHVTGSDFVDKDNFVIVVAEFELDIPKVKAD